MNEPYMLRRYLFVWCIGQYSQRKVHSTHAAFYVMILLTILLIIMLIPLPTINTTVKNAEFVHNVIGMRSFFSAGLLRNGEADNFE